MPLDFRRFTVLTFDCYGTLIDWEAGILGALHSLLATRGIHASDAHLLREYARFEAVEEEMYRPYREILGNVVGRFGGEYGFAPTGEEQAALPDSLPTWPPFPDTIESLRVLKRRYKLGVITNCDDDLFAATAERLKVPFDFVVTAQQAGSYKPSLRNFEAALSRIGVPKEQVLHAAESLRHDIRPARELGLSCVWVNRHADRPGPSASGGADAVPDLTVPDLQTLVRLIEEGD